MLLTQAGVDVINAGGTLDAIDLKVTQNNDATKVGTDSATPVVTAVDDAPTIVVTANDFTENSAVAGQVAATYVTADEDLDTLTVERNEPSWGLMLRLGMRRRAELDFVNADFDPENPVIIVYSIDRPTWENRA